MVKRGAVPVQGRAAGATARRTLAPTNKCEIVTNILNNVKLLSGLSVISGLVSAEWTQPTYREALHL